MEVSCIHNSETLLEIEVEDTISLTYQVFGKPIGLAPVVLVNHALTGNSNVAGDKGWWKTIIDKDAVIDTEYYTVICFNIPGNGYQNTSNTLAIDSENYTTKTIASLFWKALEKLNIHQLYAVIGGSLGGAIAWEMGFSRPKAIDYIIPIATHYKANDWLIANVIVQEHILQNSAHPIADARMHAMLLYRTPQSLQSKFKGQQENGAFLVDSWLQYHGNALQNRFSLEAYKAMNHLLKTIGQDTTTKDLEGFAQMTTATIHQIAINTDYFFTADGIKQTHQIVQSVNAKAQYSEIESIHGHDAFLIEYEQLRSLLQPIFTNLNT